MTTQILPAESGGLTQVKNLTRSDNATYKNHVGQSGMPSDIGNTEKPLTLTICNKYVSNMAWCSLIAVVAHTSEISVMLHAACNGAVCCLPSGGSLPLLVRVNVISRVHSVSRRPRMVTLAGQPQGWPVSFVPGIATPVNVTALIERCNSGGDSLTRTKEAA